MWYFHLGFEDHCWSIYLKYSSAALNACVIAFITGLELRLVQLVTQVGLLCRTSDSTRTPNLRFHNTVVCDLLYKYVVVPRARALRLYIV